MTGEQALEAWAAVETRIQCEEMAGYRVVRGW